MRVTDPDTIDAVLPQTQCQRCGYPACRPYAEAIARGEADINRCPPGGQAGIVQLAQLTGRPVRPLDPDCGEEGPIRRAFIDETRCIGCALCLDACPTDAIVGAFKHLHTVVRMDCTGCELCLPPCPVDCIEMNSHPDDQWGPTEAERGRSRFEQRQARLDAAPAAAKDHRALLDAALAKAARRRQAMPGGAA